MSGDILYPKNFNDNEALNLVVHNSGAAPATSKMGKLWFNTTNGIKSLFFHDGSTWLNIMDRANHFGNIAAANVTGLVAAITSAVKLNQLQAPDGAVAFGGQKATGLADGTAATDAATKGQVDAVSSNLASRKLSSFAAPDASVDFGNQKAINLADGVNPLDGVNKRQLDAARMGLDWKDSVRVVAETNVPLTGLQTIGGITLVDGDLVLTTAQTDATKNLAYVAHSGAWTVAPQFTNGNLSSGAYVPVEEGPRAGTKFRLATTGAITVGTTPLNWQIADVASTYTADNDTIALNNGVFSATTKMARYLEGTVGDGVATTFALTHNFGKKAPALTVWRVSDNQEVDVGVDRTSNNVTTIKFSVAPTAGQYGWSLVG